MASVCWSDSLFVAAGYGGRILTSVDGISWSSYTTGTLHNLHSVLWAGEIYVALGEFFDDGFYNSAIFSSSDGITWTERHMCLNEWYTSIITRKTHIRKACTVHQSLRSVLSVKNKITISILTIK